MKKPLPRIAFGGAGTKGNSTGTEAKRNPSTLAVVVKKAHPFGSAAIDTHLAGVVDTCDVRKRVIDLR